MLLGPVVSSMAAVLLLDAQSYSTKAVLLLIAVVVAGIPSLRKSSFFSPELRARKKGLALILEGKPAEAEACLRAALKRAAKMPGARRVRLLVCLGDALMDQERYTEAEDCFVVALDIGDSTGSCQDSMVDLHLAQKRDLEDVLETLNLELDLGAGRASEGPAGSWPERQNSLRQAMALARKAQALFLLERPAEAWGTIEKAEILLQDTGAFIAQSEGTDPVAPRETKEQQMRSVEQLRIAAINYRLGKTLAELGDTRRATDHLGRARDVDPKGKYRLLAENQLKQIGAPVGAV